MWVEAFQRRRAALAPPAVATAPTSLTSRAVMNDTNALFSPALSSLHRPRPRRYRPAKHLAIAGIVYNSQTKYTNDFQLRIL